MRQAVTSGSGRAGVAGRGLVGGEPEAAAAASPSAVGPRAHSAQGVRQASGRLLRATAGVLSGVLRKDGQSGAVWQRRVALPPLQGARLPSAERFACHLHALRSPTHAPAATCAGRGFLAAGCASPFGRPPGEPSPVPAPAPAPAPAASAAARLVPPAAAPASAISTSCSTDRTHHPFATSAPDLMRVH